MQTAGLILLYDPEDPKRFNFDPAEFEAKGIQTICADYSRIGRDPTLASQIQQLSPEAILFTHNEAMSKSPNIGTFLASVRAGYTCVSGIDPEYEDSQTTRSIHDFLGKNERLELPGMIERDVQNTRGSKGAYTLIFDFEQFGGAVFGLPRLLTTLEKYGIKATFFVTDFIADYYPEALTRLALGGHEIGIHGSTHEFLTGRSLEDQTKRVKDQIAKLSTYGTISGANFIYRMDNDTPEALHRAGIDYFVNFRKHVFYRTRYMAASTKHRFFSVNGGLRMLPVAVETYSAPKIEIQGSILSALKCAKRDGVNHISILMHPFKDAMLSRLDQTRWLIRYLRGLGLKPIRLRDIPNVQAEPNSTRTKVYYSFEKSLVDRTLRSRITDYWWLPDVYHALRIDKIADELGVTQMVAVTEAQESDKRISVFPDLFQNGTEIQGDPLSSAEDVRWETLVGLRESDRVSIVPNGFITDAINCLLFHIPRNIMELKTLWHRTQIKIRTKLKGGK